MALQFEKYEEKVGRSVDSSERSAKYRLTSVAVFVEKMKKQNKKLKKACKHLLRERKSGEAIWQKKREDAVLRLLAKQFKQRRKMLQEMCENAEDQAVTEKGEGMISGTEERNRDFEEPSIEEKSLWKKAEKQMRKREKILKKACKMSFEESRTDGQTAGDNTKNNMGVQGEKSASTNHDGKSFLQKLGDIFLKALPNLLCTIVKLLFEHVFKWGKNLRKGIA